ncbi:MAG TPA: radical SAM protein [Candidatus Krumholzibacteria bacterium]|nr:radical SAM protein [Candidatus Krumholzibacteria bacterium]HPD70285.1 radical SAM protein [Candidatus Krumholzibacteria bacterium]HRY40015.1 radical SAM protein [Candidatus Krumholzibacteria bacterium]
MFDRFQRRIDYLRISVTDKCNLRCVYCMPAEGVPPLSHDDLLTFEEIVAFTRAAVAGGITKVRLTGGEPLVRRGIVDLVRMLAEIEGIADLAMTTNGIRLPALAASLAAAGLQRVNISLDATDPKRYAAITRGGDVRQVLAGIAAAREAGLRPIKLNCVIADSPEEPDARDVAAFAREVGCEIRFVRRMDLATGRFHQVIGGAGGDCRRCNRLRLTCDGRLRPCLFDDLEFDVRALGAEAALRRAVSAKPAAGSRSVACMKAIGG